MSESLAEGRPETRMPRLLVPAALAAAIAAALAAWGTFGESDPDSAEYLIVVGIIAVATAVVFGWVVPRGFRSKASGRTALALAVLGVLTIAVFWSGLTPVLAVGGIVLGWAGRKARRGAGLSRAAIAVGLLALALDVAVYVQDMAF